MNKLLILLILFLSFTFVAPVNGQSQEDKTKKKEVRQKGNSKENKFCEVPDDTSVKIKSKEKENKSSKKEDKKDEKK